MLYCIIAPSGSGKTAVMKEVKKYIDIDEIKSYTTRHRRDFEDDTAYNFVSYEEFHKNNLEDFFEVVHYVGNYYGTKKSDIEKCLNNKKDAYIIVTYEGYKQFKSHFDGNVKSIYIDTNIDTIRDRMKKQGRTEEDIENRVNHMFAKKEMSNKYMCDYIIDNNDDIIFSAYNIYIIIQKNLKYIYIAGTIYDNTSNEIITKSDIAENFLKKCGFENVFCPTNHYMISRIDKANDNFQEMLVELMKSDCIYMLEGWEKSGRGQIEFILASSLNKKIILWNELRPII